LHDQLPVVTRIVIIHWINRAVMPAGLAFGGELPM